MTDPKRQAAGRKGGAASAAARRARPGAPKVTVKGVSLSYTFHVSGTGITPRSFQGTTFAELQRDLAAADQALKG